MNKKQMEKKVDKIIETIRQTILDFCEYGENEDEARHYAEDCRVEIRKLVEEVEDRDRKLLEEVANSDYELGKMQGIIEAKEHEQHRKKIRKELLRRYN